MQIIADLQLHSKYSRAVSNKMDLHGIAVWASRKGIQLVATGDWQHPVWFKEIQEQLKEVSPGIFALRERPTEQKNDVYFMLSTEISSIYTDGGRGRRIHNLVWSPSIAVSQKIINQLIARGANLVADGRPIVGITSKNLLKLILDVDERCMLIPAHAWTPWFGHYGSMSGYDSLEECYGDMSKYVYAIETGLSSDPLMNWQMSELDNRSIVSFSDAHSGPKLGREATVFESRIKNKDLRMEDVTYDDVAAAVKQDARGRLKIAYTIEFFPEEGKYHWDGHRNCGIKFSPYETKEKGLKCPVCKRPLTIGVDHRVLDLANRPLRMETDTTLIPNDAGLTFVYDKQKKRVPFVSAVPLVEMLIEINNNSKTKGERMYQDLTSRFSTEFDMLLAQPYDEIRKHAGATAAEAIRRMRERKITVDPGFDGVFGKVTLFDDYEKAKKSEPSNQESLF